MPRLHREYEYEHVALFETAEIENKININTIINSLPVLDFPDYSDYYHFYNYPSSIYECGTVAHAASACLCV